ncbi:MAG: YgiQ family radical SAM protein [Deltaproteobacteria bacterium]|nr:YgiQ family radical SAM protein [Deltaproteobacteria bacterium]
MSREEMHARGWDELDIIFISGDAYVDHSSFAVAIICRVLEARGFRVGIIAQPDWRSVDAFRVLGRPRLMFCVGAGNMDSMVNHMTAARKRRSDDAYSPGAKPGMRPDRATIPYAQRCREAYPDVPVVAGGVEASLRRLAHYDYWQDKVRPSILLDSKCDLVVFGMGERPITTIARRLQAGEPVKTIRDVRGTAYVLGASETAPAGEAVVELPSFEDVVAQTAEGRTAFARMTKKIHHETNPLNAKTLTQRHGQRVVVQNPPDDPLSEREMDAIYNLPYNKLPHPSYTEKIPAYEQIRFSVTIMRGCFGGCTFCSITTHQGRTIQSRSQKSVLADIEDMQRVPGYTGVISDIGGPTANMYKMRCKDPAVEKVCHRLSCIDPTICKNLSYDHTPVIDLMQKARQTRGVKKVFIASGVRMDLAAKSAKYLEELAAHHVGGHLKVAPEHISDKVLKLMKKPRRENFTEFKKNFEKASKKAGKEQYLVPYFISSHPGSDVAAMIELALFLKKNGFRPQQVQDFIPTPMDVATTMYYTGIDPLTMTPVHVAKGLNDKKTQRALMQFFRPENYFVVREALEKAGRKDLIGTHCDALIPPYPPREALEARKRDRERFAGPPPKERPKTRPVRFDAHVPGPLPR